MKTIIANHKKWILPSLLVATLAANAHYQSKSLIYGSSDLASEAQKDTEGKAAQVCTDGKCTLSQDQFNELMNFVRKAKEEKPEEIKITKKSKKDDVEEKDEVKETASEKRKRLAQEKKEKLKEKFNAEVDALADKCDSTDFDCLSSGLSSLLNRYSGSKKLDSSSVTSAYNKLLSKPLRKALESSDAETLSSLADLINEIPEEYKSLRTKTLDIVKISTQLKAQSINNQYKLVDQLTKQNNPQQAQQQFASAQSNLQNLQLSTSSFVQTVANNAAYSDDNVTLNYIKENFDMNKLFANITSVTGGYNNQQQTNTNGQQGSLQQNGTSNVQKGTRTGIATLPGVQNNNNIGSMNMGTRTGSGGQVLTNQSVNMNQMNMLPQQNLNYQQQVYPQNQSGGGITFKGTRN